MTFSSKPGTLRRCCVRTLVFSLMLAFAATVSASEVAEAITRASAFSQPIRWTGSTTPAEEDSRAVLAALLAGERDGRGAALAALEGFVTERPASPWTPSLRSHLARHYHVQGRLTLALAHWEAAWQATGSATDGEAKRIADYTLAHWTRLLASLGRKEELARLFAETRGRTLDAGPLQQLFSRTREALGTMAADPGISYRCGTFALSRVAFVLRGTNYDSQVLRDARSPEGGFSLSALVEFSRRLGLELDAVQRTRGDELIVPSVIHWRQNHYAAIVAHEGGMYQVIDPTFGHAVWRSAETINAEASGFFLVPGGAAVDASRAWRPLARAETDRICGQGFPNSIDDEEDQASEDCPPKPGHGSAAAGGDGEDCGCVPSGMARWRVSEPYINVWFHDEPLGYQPSRGPRLSFLVS